MIVLAPLILAAAVTVSLQQASADSAVDPETGVVFPVRLQVPGGDAMHTLVGTGVRTKTFLRVKVYAFGLYVDAPAAQSALAAWAGRSAADLERDASFYGELLKDNFAKTLRLVMTRNVDGATMAEAFENALGPRVRRAGQEMGMPGGEEALATFRGYFSLSKLTKGSELVFSWVPGGKLVTTIQGKTEGEIASPALCWALFDVYLGADPISPGGKKTVIARFPQLLGQ